MDKEDIKKLAIEQLSKETTVADYFVRVDLEDEFVDRCILISQKLVKKLNIDDVGKCQHPYKMVISGDEGMYCTECNEYITENYA